MTQRIAIDLLVPHPQNCNRMDEGTLRKLRRHMERTGRYEPLTVRPHPQEDGKYQVLNGHHRLRVLRALNYEEVLCTVWDMDDGAVHVEASHVFSGLPPFR
jgi:ParB family chromosome partitioning protein